MNVILLLTAGVITVLVSTWLVEVLKDTAQTAIAIGLIVLIVLMLFGIHPGDVFQQIKDLLTI
ncbi:MAG TPA: hypothetical protein ACFE0H_14775 [Elainellaceae cyanobacterium]|jgi:hypothetical protein